MPNTLTEIANFPDEVVVPDASDDMSLAAEAVEAFVQVLANRTRYLKGFTDDAALTTGDVIFTGRVTSNRVDPTKAGFRAGFGPHDATGLPANKWIPLINGRLTGAMQVRLYQGDGVEGWTAIAVNANYDSTADTPEWKYDDAAHKAYCFMLDVTGAWRVYSYGGSDGWTAWDNNDSQLKAHGISADEFSYIVAAPHDERVNLSYVQGQSMLDRIGGTGAVMFQPDVDATKYTVMGVDHCDLIFPLNLKRDTVVSHVTIEMNHSTSPSVSDVFTLRRRHGALGAIAYDDVVHASPSTGVGDKTVTLTPGSPFTVARGEEYSLVWTLTDLGGISAAKVYGIDVNCTQPGPRP